MTQKKFIINNCSECPAYECGPRCGIADNPNNIIPEASEIPEWCPLEDI